MNYARALFLNGWTVCLVLSFAAVEGYNLLGLPTLTQFQQSRLRKAEADNADALREAERIDTQAKAKQASEVARYAERNQSALARLKSAQAEIAASEAKIADEASKNASLKALADAKLQQAQNEFNQAKLASEDQKTYQAARLEKAKACAAEIKAHSAIFDNFIVGNRLDTVGSVSDVERFQRTNHSQAYDPAHNPCGDPPAPDQPQAQSPPPALASGPQTAAAIVIVPLHLRARIMSKDSILHTAPDGQSSSAGDFIPLQIVKVTGKTEDGRWLVVEGTCRNGHSCKGFMDSSPRYIQNADN